MKKLFLIFALSLAAASYQSAQAAQAAGDKVEVETLECLAVNVLGTSSIKLNKESKQLDSVVYSTAGVFHPKLKVSLVDTDTDELAGFNSRIVLSDSEAKNGDMVLAFFSEIPLNRDGQLTGALLMPLPYANPFGGSSAVPVAALSCKVLLVDLSLL